MLKIFQPSVNLEHIDGTPRNPAPPVLNVGNTASREPLQTVPADAGSDGFVNLTGGGVIDDDLTAFSVKAKAFAKQYGIYIVAALLLAFVLKGKKA